MEGSGNPMLTNPKEGKNIRKISKCNSLDITYANAQTIINKIDKFRSVTPYLKPDIIQINESWAHNYPTKKNRISDAYLSING